MKLTIKTSGKKFIMEFEEKEMKAKDLRQKLSKYSMTPQIFLALSSDPKCFSLLRTHIPLMDSADIVDGETIYVIVNPFPLIRFAETETVLINTVTEMVNFFKAPPQPSPKCVIEMSCRVKQFNPVELLNDYIKNKNKEYACKNIDDITEAVWVPGDDILVDVSDMNEFRFRAF
jgi:hypothetical protein